MQWLNIAYVRWYSSQMIKKFGILGMLALTITLGCCLLYALNILPLQKKIVQDTLRLQQENKQKALSDATEQLPLEMAPKQTTAESIKRFYAQFPALERLPNCLRLIDNIALKQRLSLNRGDYKLTQIKSLQTNQGALSRYEIVLPVSGQYIQIRQFTAQVLHELPALALTDLHLKRESAQSPTVEARLIFVLLLKNSTGADPWQ
jgi:Tfp pilus assembly protein PilO